MKLLATIAVVFAASISAAIADVPIPEPRPWTIAKTQAEQCMALNIYHEARHMSYKSQVAVGLVTLNRLKSDKFPDTICEVVTQKKQFSWFWDSKPDKPNEIDAWITAQLIALAILDKTSAIIDFTYGSQYYHADWMENYPRWSRKFVKVAHYEEHIFYKE